MATFKQYDKKDGTSAWLFQAYLGVDSITGKPIKTTRRNFKTKKEAQLALSHLQVNFHQHGLDTKKDLTFRELYSLWFSQHKQNITATTQQRIEIFFDKHILKEFGDSSVKKITPLYCQKQLNNWAKKYVTYKQMRTYTGLVFNYGILIGVLSDNPMSRTILPKRQQKKSLHESDSYYTKEELKIFLNCLLQLKDYRAYTFFRVLSFGGLRKGEAMALLWEDIDFENNSIEINKNLAELKSGEPIIQNTKNESSIRTVRLDNTTMSILRKWKNYTKQEKIRLGIREDNFDSTLVFSNSRLKHKNQYLYKAYPNNIMKKVAKKFPKMKIIRVHDFRKTNASLLFESGASIKDVSHRLGHKSIKTTTDIYIKVTQIKQNDTAEKFATYMAF